jgi:hypothetical protein
MVINLDMANAFDKVSHGFLKEVLKKIGFDQAFISWIGTCISTPWIAPLINGRPTPFFKASRGLRQGFPLSPLLYVLMVESLNTTLEWECTNGSIPGICIARGVKRINHSQFMDDTMLPSGASKVMEQRIKEVLDNFILVFGGRINNHKSQIYVWNTKAHYLIGIAQILGFPISNDWKSFKYLGLPICLKSLPGEYWHVIIQKVKEKMEAWGAIWLNPTGASSANQISFVLPPPFSVLFSSGSSRNKKRYGPTHLKIPLARRQVQLKKIPSCELNIVSSSKDQGGLGIRDPELANIALGAKLLWRLVSGNKEWWKTTIVKKYKMGTRKRCLDQEQVSHNGSPIWKLLRSSIPHFKEKLT